MRFQNELMLAASIVLCFGGLVLFFRVFKKEGVYAWTVIESIAANIEVLILIKAFGMEMTLGNVLFASSFLATDILSEVYGKKEADKAVWIGIATTVTFIMISLCWSAYIPSQNDVSWGKINAVFSQTPRIMLASLAAYVVSELLDVWFYHKWWDFTTKKCNDRKKFLWLRNNVSTLTAQLLNTAVFTVLAFWNTYDFKTLVSIALSSYVIFIFTSLLDTPFVYFARWLGEKYKLGDKDITE
jgi:uncharacterized integral membrane protein (TIGR00697 family)